MRLIEAARKVLQVFEGRMNAELLALRSAVETHDEKINLNRAKKLLKKAEQEQENESL